MSEWFPIDTAPLDGRLALVAMSGGDVVIVPLVPARELSYADRLELAKGGHWPDRRRYTPTHWMPLPVAPAQPSDT